MFSMEHSMMMNSSSSMNSCMIPTSSSCGMDSRIWRNLPEPLLDRVLAFLPAPSFFRFRSVSKRLYSLLFSDAFLRLHLHLSPHLLHPSFLFFPTTCTSLSSSSFLLLLDPAASTWHRLPLPDAIPPQAFSPAASSGGLLCFLSNDPGPKTLLLLNPLSRLAAQLPRSPRHRLLPSVGLAVGASSLSLLLAGDDMISPYAVKNLTSEAFHADGATGFYSPWATPLSPLPRLCSLDTGRMALSAGKFYCISCAPFSVLAYDIATNAWATIHAPMRRFLRSPTLLALPDHHDTLLMVAAVDKRKLTVPKSLRVWQLQPAGSSSPSSWDEVERMPLEVHRQFDEAEGGRGFECVACGGYIALTMANSTNVILFDFPRREWRWAPPCPFASSSSSSSAGGLRGFGYEPRLATPAVGLIDSAAPPFQGFAG